MKVKTHVINFGPVTPGYLVEHKSKEATTMELKDYRIGVIGGGVVGSAIANSYRGYVKEVRVYDINLTKGTHPTFEQVIHPKYTDLVFLCTPEHEVERFLTHVRQEIRQFQHWVIKSTVPVGTTKRLSKELLIPNLVFSPEFLTERTADEDAANPRANFIGFPLGTEKDEIGKIKSTHRLIELYTQRFPGIWRNYTNSCELEAAKIYTNTFFAVKVAMFNEFYQVTSKLGLNWETVRQAMLEDGRIKPLHTQVPGPDGKLGWGGKCFPKDLDQFLKMMYDIVSTGTGLKPDTIKMLGTSVAQAAKNRNMYDRNRKVAE